jgi:hypothetical protein
MKKVCILLIFLGLQSCIRHYSEKIYNINQDVTEKESSKNAEELYIKEEVIGIEDIMFFKCILNIYIYESKIPEKMNLDNVKLYNGNRLLGEIKVNENLLKDEGKTYTKDGKLIYQLNLKTQFIDILEDKEKELEISRYGVSKDIKFLFEFYDKENNEKYIVMNYYKISKYDKGWEFWIPDI